MIMYPVSVSDPRTRPIKWLPIDRLFCEDHIDLLT